MTGAMTTSSRMTYDFARDGGLPFSQHLSQIHPKLGSPLNALVVTLVLNVIFGCIFLGSTAAFSAITAASVVALGVSYAIPIALHLVRGKGMLPETRAFRLPGWFAWGADVLGVVYVVVTTVLFMFPPALPVTGSNMNYCVVAFAVVLVVSSVQWFVDGRKNFSGPKIEVVGDGERMAEMTRKGETFNIGSDISHIEKL